jgi:hypothetical protein
MLAVSLVGISAVKYECNCSYARTGRLKVSRRRFRLLLHLVDLLELASGAGERRARESRGGPGSTIRIPFRRFSALVQLPHAPKA